MSFDGVSKKASQSLKLIKSFKEMKYEQVKMTNFGFDKVLPMTNDFVETKVTERAQVQERTQQAKSSDEGNENDRQSVVSVNSQEEEDLIDDFEELKQLISTTPKQ